jgi:hypothetical protein
MVAQTHVSAVQGEGQNDSLLRRGLIGNAIFSAITGTLMIAGTGAISEFMGLTPAWVPAAIGAGVLLWAIDVGWLARKDNISASKAWMVIAGDLLWVVASYGIIVSGVPELTTGGKWTLAIVAEIVGLFAVAQYLGLRRMRS